MIRRTSRTYTLASYIQQYDPQHVQLVCGDHLVNISFDKEGSWFIVKAFRNTEFRFKSFENGLLVLVA